MSNPLADQLRAIADQLDGIEPGTAPAAGPLDLKIEPGHTLLETGPNYPDWGPDQIIPADFWVKGRVGAMKGARASDYSIASTLAYKLLGDVPPHLYTVADPKLGPPGASGLQLLASVADAGWVNGRDYRPLNPPGLNYLQWNAAGRPTANRFGRYDTRGELVIPGAFSPGTPAG